MLKNSKLTTTLKTLTPKEWKTFLHFLQSPYFNTNQNQIKLAKALHKFHPTYEHKKYTKEQIFIKVFGSKKEYKENIINIMMSQLMKLAEQFLMQQQLEKNKSMQRQLRLGMFKEKRLDDYFFREAEQQKADLLLQEHRRKYFYYEMHLLNEEIANHPMTNASMQMLPSLVDSYDYLQKYILWEAVDWTMVIENRREVLKEKHDSSLFDAILDCNDSFIKENNYLSLMASIIEYQRSPSESFLLEIVFNFKEKVGLMGEEDQILVFISLTNLITSKIREGGKNHYNIYFELYKIVFNEEYLIIEKIITPFLYINAISIACLCEDFNWANIILEKYIDNIPLKKKVETYNYAKMTYLFQLGIFSRKKEELEGAINFYNNLSNLTEQSHIVAKFYLLRCHFELCINKGGDSEFLLNFCDSFQKYLDRTVSVKQQKVKIFNVFIKNMKALIKLSSEPVKTEALKNKFKSRLLAKDAKLAESWFLKKIEEIK